MMHSWGDFKRIKSGNISTISRNVSDKQSIVYTSAYVESGIIALSVLEFNIDERYTRHVWDNDDEVLDNTLERWGVEKIMPHK